MDLRLYETNQTNSCVNKHIRFQFYQWVVMYMYCCTRSIYTCISERSTVFINIQKQKLSIVWKEMLWLLVFFVQAHFRASKTGCNEDLIMKETNKQAAYLQWNKVRFSNRFLIKIIQLFTLNYYHGGSGQKANLRKLPKKVNILVSLKC